MGRPSKPGSRGHDYYVRNRERLQKKHARYRVNLRLEVLAHYGPNGILKCSWSGCDITDPDMLALDHVNNDGSKDRAKRKSGVQLYQQLRNDGFPDGLQTLCCNHNQKKETMRSRGIL